MRKLSKSRTDDDAVSSTNESAANENGSEPDQDANGGTESEETQANNDSTANSDNDLGDGEKEKESPTSKDPPKKRGSKSRPKKKVEKKEDAGDGDDDEEYEVEKILDSKKLKGKLHYLIRWKGYSAGQDTWEAHDSLSCPDLIEKFQKEHPDGKGAKTKTNKRKATESKKSQKGKGKETPAKKTKKDFDFENADSNAEYEVDRILEVHHKKNGNREFLIHWKGWSSKFDSWEPEEHLNCKELIQKFMAKVDKARETDSRSLRTAPKSTDRFTLQESASGRRLSKRGNQRQRVRYDDAE